MIESDIRKLSELPGSSLDHLETDIWAGVEARLKERHAFRIVFSSQAAVLCLALLVSAAMGTRAAMAENSSGRLGLFSTHADLAPSTRLIGY